MNVMQSEVMVVTSLEDEREVGVVLQEDQIEVLEPNSLGKLLENIDSSQLPEFLGCLASNKGPWNNPELMNVPLALFGGSGNYASALYLAATKSNLLEKVESEMIDLVEASKKSPLFTQFIRDLSVHGETRVNAIKDITSQAKFTEITRRN